jgi:hypothetical protein
MACRRGTTLFRALTAKTMPIFINQLKKYTSVFSTQFTLLKLNFETLYSRVDRHTPAAEASHCRAGPAFFPARSQ